MEGNIMTKSELIKKLELMVKQIGVFQSTLTAKYPNQANDMQIRNFIDSSQFVKTDCVTRIEQLKKHDGENLPNMYSEFLLKNIDTNFKAVELHFNTLMNSNVIKYKPSDPNKTKIR